MADNIDFSLLPIEKDEEEKKFSIGDVSFLPEENDAAGEFGRIAAEQQGPFPGADTRHTSFESPQEKRAELIGGGNTGVEVAGPVVKESPVPEGITRSNKAVVEDWQNREQEILRLKDASKWGKTPQFLENIMPLASLIIGAINPAFGRGTALANRAFEYLKENKKENQRELLRNQEKQLEMETLADFYTRSTNDLFAEVWNIAETRPDQFKEIDRAKTAVRGLMDQARELAASGDYKGAQAYYNKAAQEAYRIKTTFTTEEAAGAVKYASSAIGPGGEAKSPTAGGGEVSRNAYAATSNPLAGKKLAGMTTYEILTSVVGSWSGLDADTRAKLVADVDAIKAKYANDPAAQDEALSTYLSQALGAKPGVEPTRQVVPEATPAEVTSAQAGASSNLTKALSAVADRALSGGIDPEIASQIRVATSPELVNQSLDLIEQARRKILDDKANYLEDGKSLKPEAQQRMRSLNEAQKMLSEEGGTVQTAMKALEGAGSKTKSTKTPVNVSGGGAPQGGNAAPSGQPASPADTLDEINRRTARPK